MKQISTRDQMTQKLKTIGHCTAFNNAVQSALKGIKNCKFKTTLTRN